MSQRILISRLSAVGDCIHTIPVLCALRDRFPDAHIGWAVQGGGAKLLDGHAALDELIVVPRGWMKSPRQITRLRSRLRHSRFDIALDVQSLTKSALLGWLAGAKQRIGFAPPQGREAAPWLNNVLVKRQGHVVDAYLRLLEPLGVFLPNVHFDLPRPAGLIAWGDEMVEQLDLPAEFGIINPGAGWESKLWPAERFAEVARYWGEHCGLPSLVVWSGDRERQWAEQITRQAEPFVRMAPSTSLPELAELCRRGTLFLAADTGPLHLAAAVGTACIGLYGPTRPTDCGPYGLQHQSLQAFYQGGNSRQRRGDDDSAMRAISVETVCQACETVLQQQRKSLARAA